MVDTEGEMILNTVVKYVIYRGCFGPHCVFQVYFKTRL